MAMGAVMVTITGTDISKTTVIIMAMGITIITSITMDIITDMAMVITLAITIIVDMDITTDMDIKLVTMAIDTMAVTTLKAMDNIVDTQNPDIIGINTTNHP